MIGSAEQLFGNFGRWTLLEKTFFNLTSNYYQFKTLFFDRKYFFRDELKDKLLLESDNKLDDTYEFIFDE